MPVSGAASIGDTITPVDNAKVAKLILAEQERNGLHSNTNKVTGFVEIVLAKLQIKYTLKKIKLEPATDAVQTQMEEVSDGKDLARADEG